MPIVPFETLPDSSRVWTFGSDRPLDAEQEKQLLRRVDEFLEDWKAHGAPLTAGREWRDARFLAVAVDQSDTGATGCSIDGLFRVLQRLEGATGANLVAGGRVFYREDQTTVQCVPRSEIEALASTGAISPDTVVFDLSLTDLGTWRARFEQPAKKSWVAELLP